MTAVGSAQVLAFFDGATFTVSYLVWDPLSLRAAIIDAVLGFDARSGRTDTRSAKEILDAAEAKGLKIDWILETHAHADHLSAAPYLKGATGAPIVIGEHIKTVQQAFKRLFNLDDVVPDGRPFDRLVKDGEILPLGALAIEVLHTPGHTPACVSYRIGDAVFVGDTLFMPDYGTARADFPGGDAHALYRSIRKILALAPETRLFTCHDYEVEGRSGFAWESTVAEQRARNIHIHDGVTEDAFVTMRNARDKTLAVPQLLLPSVQVNIRAGELPDPESNGVRYLKIPIDAL